MLPTDIIVTLTTSKNMTMCSDPKVIPILQHRPIPICVAEFKINSKSEYKRVEPFFYNCLFELCGDVLIDVDNREIRIRERQGSHFLIDANFNNATKIQKDFFEAYKKYSILLFEYQVFLKENIKKSLKGIWVKDKWIQLKFCNKGFIHITSSSILN